MIFSVDSGNTFFKIAVFEGRKLFFFKDRLDAAQAASYACQYKPRQIVLCDVAQRTQEFINQLKIICPALAPNIILLNSQTKIPIKNLYQTPHTLGMDRLAAILGAWHLAPSQNSLVIDAGTCITYDLITADGAYQGGSISLGLTMRYQALHKFTAKLPELSLLTTKPPLTGKTTAEAMHSGVIVGLCAEIQGIIAAYQQQYDNLQVFICGGNAEILLSYMEKPKQIILRNSIVVEGLSSLVFEDTEN
jgi:type III pantothenate kinase